MKLTKISDLLKAVGLFLYSYLTAILFLSGLIVLNVAMYLEFDVFIGLVVTSISLMFVGWLLNYESEKYVERSVKK